MPSSKRTEALGGLVHCNGRMDATPIAGVMFQRRVSEVWNAMWPRMWLGKFFKLKRTVGEVVCTDKTLPFSKDSAPLH
jgi:hypothetical protein